MVSMSHFGKLSLSQFESYIQTLQLIVRGNPIEFWCGYQICDLKVMRSTSISHRYLQFCSGETLPSNQNRGNDG